MTNYQIWIINIILILNFINADILIDIGDATANAGETAEVAISIDNLDDIVAGFQLQIIDSPNYGGFIDFQTTDRTEDCLLTFNEQPDGSIMALVIDVSNNSCVDQGTGPVLIGTYESTSIYSSEIAITLNEENSILSSMSAEILEYTYNPGNIIINGEDPPPIFPPEDLSVIGGYLIMNLSWSHPNPENISGYNIFRDGTYVGNSSLTNYTDTGLEQEVEYCYSVSAFNDYVESELSEEACDTTLTQFFEPPQNLTANEDGLTVYLDWDLPNGELGECEDQYGYGYVPDCSGDGDCCPESWIGDGFADCEDQAWGCDLTCYDNDGGDCGYAGLISNNLGDKTGIQPYQNQTRDVLYYEVFRDNIAIGNTFETEYVDNEGLEYLIDYCYNVTAIYDDPGTSGFSNTACVAPQLSAPFGLSAEGTGSFITIEWNPPQGSNPDSYNLFKDGLFLTSTTENNYEDYETEMDTDYCYTVTAVFDEIGESPESNEDCGSWNIYPPSNITTEDGDGFVDIFWEEPSNPLPNLVGTWTLDYDWFCDGVDGSANLVFYEDGSADLEGYYGAYNMQWVAEIGVVDLPGSYCPELVFEYNAYFYFVDFNTYYYFWIEDEYGEGPQDSGGYYGPEPSSDGHATLTFVSSDREYINIAEHVENIISPNPIDLFERNQNIDHNNTFQYSFRSLLNYDIFRDNEYLTTVPADTFHYRDEDVVNMVEYCYVLRSNYDEGTSEFSDQICEIPNPGPPATNLIANDLGEGDLGLEWTASLSEDVLDYNIYKDGELLHTTIETNYIDSDNVAGIEFCYEVYARYISGETFPTNTACATYVLEPPVGVYAQGDDDAQNITISWHEPGSLAQLDLEIFTDAFPTETYWDIYDVNGAYIDGIVPGDLTTSETTFTWSLLIPPGEYTFNIYDTYGDGICCIYGDGYYNLLINGTQIATGGDFGTQETTEFNTNGMISSIIDYRPVELLNINKTIGKVYKGEVETIFKSGYTIHNLFSREMLSYRVYRNDLLLVELDTDTFSYVDNDSEHDITYCYVVKAVYTDGESIPSNESCAIWILPPPTELDASGTNGQIELSWLAADSDELLNYSIYKDSTLLITTTDLYFNDSETVPSIEYCYHVVANYELGASQATDLECATWEMLPPNEIFTEGLDGVVHVTWTDPPPGGEPGIGDECIYYDYDYNEALGYVDCIGQCVSEVYLSWLGDGLCDDGSWGVYFNCDEWNWDEGDCQGRNIQYRTKDDMKIKELLVKNTATQSLQNNNQMRQIRSLTSWDIYRDGDLLENISSDIYEYFDSTVVNLTEYCYQIIGVYDEGSSDFSDTSCSIPIPGEAPSSLSAQADHELGVINLLWQEGEMGALEYKVYKDGVHYGTVTETNHTDENIIVDELYCYQITAIYPSGESLPSNESCASWVLAPPLSFTAYPGDGNIQLEWDEPGVSACADETIPSLPFSTIGSNLGMGDDWVVQGSQGEDYSYLLNVFSPITITVSLCSENTTFDTKLEIFTADPECNAITTNYYIDDFTCDVSPVGSLASTLENVFLEPGQYYIVVDGFSGSTGDYEIFVEQTNMNANRPNDILYNIEYESNKVGFEIGFDDWNIADETIFENSRNLIEFEIYKQNTLLTTVDGNTYSYLDNDVINGTNYCYHMVAIYEEGNSQPTPQSCAEPCSETPAPENLSGELSDNGDFVTLYWETPIGECADLPPYECDPGYVIDCTFDGDCCPETWIGDGFADCEDQAYGCDLTCYDNDGGDCVDPFCGDGICNGYETEADCPEDCASSEACTECEFDYTNYGSECCDTAWEEFGIDCITLETYYSWDCSGCNCPGDGFNVSIKELNSFNILPIQEYPANDMKNVEDIMNMNQSRELMSYQIYKNDLFLDEVNESTLTYEDSDIQSQNTNCYYLKAVYDDNTSNPSNEVCISNTLSLEDSKLPDNFKINSIYPNPFNPLANIIYGIPDPGIVEIRIYDISGRLIEAIFKDYVEAGYHQYTWNAKTHSSGVYLIQISYDKQILKKKIILMK